MSGVRAGGEASTVILAAEADRAWPRIFIRGFSGGRHWTVLSSGVRNRSEYLKTHCGESVGDGSECKVTI